MDRTRNINKPVHYRVKKVKLKAIKRDYSAILKALAVVAGILTLIGLITFKN